MGDSAEGLIESEADELQLFFHSKRLFYRKFPAIVAARKAVWPRVGDATVDRSTLTLKATDWAQKRTVVATRDPHQQRRTAVLNRSLSPLHSPSSSSSFLFLRVSFPV